MPVDDFDVERLAAYLHLDPAQVARLADRGRLPGRKVAGQWRFSPREIHDWLEERIGLSTDEELQHMEGALRRPPGRATEAEVAVSAPAAARCNRHSVGGPHPGERDHVDVRVGGPHRLAVGSGKNGRGSDCARTCCPRRWKVAWRCSIRRRPLPNILGQAFLPGRTRRGIPFGGAARRANRYFFPGLLGRRSRPPATAGPIEPLDLAAPISRRAAHRSGHAGSTGPDCPAQRSLGRRLIDTRNV